MVLHVFIGGIELAVEVAVDIIIAGVSTPHQWGLGHEVIFASDKRGDGHHDVDRTAGVRRDVDDEVLDLRVGLGLIERIDQDDEGQRF